MELTKETRDRIYAAADALFEQNGRDAFRGLLVFSAISDGTKS